MQPAGYKLASLIANSISQAPFVRNASYREIEEYVYHLVQSIAHEQEVGDWLETPNGTTYELTFKPTYRNANDHLQPSYPSMCLVWPATWLE
jgi:hypothetical protein